MIDVTRNEAINAPVNNGLLDHIISLDLGSESIAAAYFNTQLGGAQVINLQDVATDYYTDNLVYYLNNNLKSNRMKTKIQLMDNVVPVNIPHSHADILLQNIANDCLFKYFQQAGYGGTIKKWMPNPKVLFMRGADKNFLPFVKSTTPDSYVKMPPETLISHLIVQIVNNFVIPALYNQMFNNNNNTIANTVCYNSIPKESIHLVITVPNVYSCMHVKKIIDFVKGRLGFGEVTSLYESEAVSHYILNSKTPEKIGTGFGDAKNPYILTIDVGKGTTDLSLGQRKLASDNRQYAELARTGISSGGSRLDYIIVNHLEEVIKSVFKKYGKDLVDTDTPRISLLRESGGTEVTEVITVLTEGIPSSDGGLLLDLKRSMDEYFCINRDILSIEKHREYALEIAKIYLKSMGLNKFFGRNISVDKFKKALVFREILTRSLLYCINDKILSFGNLKDRIDIFNEFLLNLLNKSQNVKLNYDINDMNVFMSNNADFVKACEYLKKRVNLIDSLIDLDIDNTKTQINDAYKASTDEIKPVDEIHIQTFITSLTKLKQIAQSFSWQTSTYGKLIDGMQNNFIFENINEYKKMISQIDELNDDTTYAVLIRRILDSNKKVFENLIPIFNILIAKDHHVYFTKTIKSFDDMIILYEKLAKMKFNCAFSPERQVKNNFKDSLKNYINCSINDQKDNLFTMLELSTGGKFNNMKDNLYVVVAGQASQFKPVRKAIKDIHGGAFFLEGDESKDACCLGAVYHIVNMNTRPNANYLFGEYGVYDTQIGPGRYKRISTLSLNSHPHQAEVTFDNSAGRSVIFSTRITQGDEAPDIEDNMTAVIMPVSGKSYNFEYDPKNLNIIVNGKVLDPCAVGNVDKKIYENLWPEQLRK